MISLFKPKYTLQRVALEIQSGLKDESVFLNDESLNEAGYEVRTIESVADYSFFGKIAIACPVILYSLAIGLGYTQVWCSWLHYVVVSLLINFYVMLVVDYVGNKIGSSQRRYITKKSSRGD